MRNIIKDTEFIKGILPSHYNCELRERSIRCKSKIGVKMNIDGEDDEHWFYILNAIKNYFKDSFVEVNHTVCSNHQDFTIYLRK